MCKRLLFSVLSVVLICCGPPNLNDPDPVSPVNPISPDKPEPREDVSYTCNTAEVRIQELCDEDSSVNEMCCLIVKPTAKGKTFTEFCKDVQKDGVDLHVDCLSEINSCGQIDECTNSK